MGWGGKFYCSEKINKLASFAFYYFKQQSRRPSLPAPTQTVPWASGAELAAAVAGLQQNYLKACHSELVEQKVWLPQRPGFPQEGVLACSPPYMNLCSYFSNVYASKIPPLLWKLNGTSQVAETELFLYKLPKGEKKKMGNASLRFKKPQASWSGVACRCWPG